MPLAFRLLGLISLALPALAARRFGARVGAIASGLWLALAVGAFLLGLGVLDAFSSADPRVVQAALAAACALLVVHLAALTRPRLRGPAFRALVLLPGTTLACAVNLDLVTYPVGRAAPSKPTVSSLPCIACGESRFRATK